MTSALISEITRASHDIMRSFKRQMLCCTGDDLHLGQLHALSCVGTKGGMTMKELADALHVSSPSATTFADRLVAMKYLSRTHDPKNRRIVRLTLTSAGKRILIQKMKEKQWIVETVLDVLSDTDKRTFLRILQKVQKNCKI